MKTWWHGLGMLALALAGTAAQADRSKLSEDEHPFEPGDCELESAWQRSTPRGAPSQRQSAWQLSCAVWARTEMALALERQRNDGVREQALGAEAKVKLLERATGRPSLTLRLASQWQRLDSGPWRHATQAFGVEAALQPGPGWLVEGSLGTQRERSSGRNHGTWELALERRLAEAVEIKFSWAGQEGGPPAATLGLRLQVVPEHLLLTLSLGRRGGAQPERIQGLALTVEF